MAELERLDAVVAHAVSADPEERYVSAREMAADLALTLEPASPAEVASWVTGNGTRCSGLARGDGRRVVPHHRPGDDAGPASEPPTLVKTTADALLPIIVAELEDAAALHTVAEIAHAQGTLIVPLLTPPGDASDHILEVHVPGEDKPMLFLARAAGAPGERGFPLRLRPYGVWTEPSPARPDSPTASVLARGSMRRSITESHSRDLTFSGSAADLVERDVLGRTLHVQGGRLVLEERLAEEAEAPCTAHDIPTTSDAMSPSR